LVKFGWFSTGRDSAARELLETVFKGIKSGDLKGEISFVFCSRERGESEESDYFIDLVKEFKIPFLSLSAKSFLPELREAEKEKWRTFYHREVEKIISSFEFDFIVLAGYMLIVSSEFCQKYLLINLHPALPGGPAGSWQEVIWKVLEKKDEEHGAMMHLVTPELDKGPPLTYYTFSLKSPEFSSLREEFYKKVEEMSFEDLKEREGEENSLFKKIREEGVKRELPLIYLTIRLLLEGKIEVKEGKIFYQGRKLEGGLCLNEEVESWLKNQS
jgi:phosphoribosylglycinamide formyltransferase-1